MAYRERRPHDGMSNLLGMIPQIALVENGLMLPIAPSPVLARECRTEKSIRLESTQSVKYPSVEFCRVLDRIYRMIQDDHGGLMCWSSLCDGPIPV